MCEDDNEDHSTAIEQPSKSAPGDHPHPLADTPANQRDVSAFPATSRPAKNFGRLKKASPNDECVHEYDEESDSDCCIHCGQDRMES